MTPQLVIPMTGISSRFTAAGYDRPKFLLEVDGELVIDHVLDMYPGWDDVVFICNQLHLDDDRFDLRAHLLARRPDAVIVALPNGRALGPGSAVLEAREHIDLERPVVVNYCDFTCYWDVDEFERLLTRGDLDGVIPVYTGFHPHMAFSTSYAYVKMQGELAVDIQEKQPWTDDPASEYASSGTYGFASGRVLLDALDAQVAQRLTLKDEYYLSLTYLPLMRGGARIGVFPLQHFMQWGTPQDFEEYRDYSRAIASWSRREVGQSRPYSRVVLASGAGARFSRAGYILPKPALPLAGRTLLEHSVSGVPGNRTVVVTRADLGDQGAIESVAAEIDAEVAVLPALSRGQAESALHGLRMLPPDSPVTVTACDAIAVTAASHVDDAFAEAGVDGLVVWLARPYHLALRRPEQYGWAEVRDGRVGEVWLKQSPGAPDAAVVTGTFGFGTARSAIRAIEQLIADDDRVNGEFYLDSLIARFAANGRPVVGLVLPEFVSVGTPAEYESARYWQSCFHKWALHPYTLSADPMVRREDRAVLDHEMRRFPRTVQSPVPA